MQHCEVSRALGAISPDSGSGPVWALGSGHVRQVAQLYGRQREAYRIHGVDSSSIVTDHLLGR